MRDLSVVIPSLDEEERIGETLRGARRAFGSGAELIVADGGSRDATRERAYGLARVVRAGGGRGPQLNAGATAARGDVLIFLHADTRPEPGSGRLVTNALAAPGVVGGCFRFAVSPPAGAAGRYRLLEAGVRLRTRLFRTATGDQILFAKRAAFRRAGGFPDYPLFEDVVFVRRLRRLGRFALLDAVARTSRRRWEEGGFWTTVLEHWGLRAAFRMGVSPHRLAAWYRTGREGASATDRTPDPGSREGRRAPTART